MRTLLGWVLVAAIAGGCASAAPTESRTEVPIADVKMLAGAWIGYIVFDNGRRADNVTLTISDQGAYQVSGRGSGGNSFATNGEITAGSGSKASYRSTRSSGTVALFKAGTKDILRMDGASALGGGYGEYERTK